MLKCQFRIVFSHFWKANTVIERYMLDDIYNGLSSADGGNVVLDFVDPDGSGVQAIAMSKRYLYGEAVDQIFAQEDLSKTLGDATRNLWPLVDHLGTVRDLAKQDGTIAAHYKYDSFGNVTSGDTSKTRYLFTSREFDTATKLQYNRARYHDAAVGRWISEDPLGFAAGDANVARYVRNIVNVTTDASGLQEPPFNPWDPEVRRNTVSCIAGCHNHGGISRPTVPPSDEFGSDPSAGMILPGGPGDLPPEWQLDPTHRAPNGQRFRHPGGDHLDWHPGRPGKPRHQGRDHWHLNDGDQHLYPGDEIPDPPPIDTSERIILIGLGIGLIIGTLIEDGTIAGIADDPPTIGTGVAMIIAAF
jgi:RHS repeat-associated protein